MTETGNDARHRASPAALALAWMEADAQPRIICTTALELVWANSAARNPSVNGGELDLKDGAIALRERTAQAGFCAFVKACGPVLTTLALPRETGNGHLLLRGRRIGEEDGYGLVGLTFLYSGNMFRPLYADLDNAFQLTPAEHRILLRMIDGLNAEGIAEAKQLSIETVRSHIRNIYNKMGVTTRESMFAKARPFQL